MNDMRKFITLVENQELDEAGGMIDRMLSKLPDWAGGASAEGRVDKREMFKLLRKSWLKHAASIDVDKKDPQELRDYLAQASLSDDQIAQLPLDGNIDLNDVFKVAAAMVNKNAGVSFGDDKKGGAGGAGGAGGSGGKGKGSPSGDSRDDIMRYFQRTLGGNKNDLDRAARKTKSNSLKQQKDHLGVLGLAHYNASGEQG